jgi:hypothetical protein
VPTGSGKSDGHARLRWLSRTPVLAVLALALGLANTVALFGWGPLDPTNVAWIFGDNASYYIGWALYRHDPHLTFPLAWTDRIGYPVGTSIALIDAIPLVAILLRPVSPILSEPFQYLGLYSALCFVLQAFLGFLLCRRLFPSRPTAVVIGGLLFLLSPPLTWRAFGHTALLSHWLILASLLAYMQDTRDRPLAWMARQWAIVALAAAITPYIAAMCFLIALAAVVRLVLERRCGWIRAVIVAAATFAVLVAGLAVVGVVGLRSASTSTYQAPGYGLFSMNLNAPVNPMDYGAVLLPSLPLIHPAQVEGYNYLGLGVLGLIATGLLRRPRTVNALASRRWAPLVGLAAVSLVLAASATVSFGSRTLFEIVPPDAVLRALEGLRASGRLFWPGYYLIVSAALVMTARAWAPATGTAVLLAALVVQAADVRVLRARVRAMVDQRFESPLQAPAWHALAGQVDTLVVLPAYQCDPYHTPGEAYGNITFGMLAASQGLRTNSFGASRYGRDELYAHCVDRLRAELGGELDPRAAYVVTDAVRTVWAATGMQSHRCDVADGFNLCTPVPPGGTPASLPVPEAAEYVPGTVLDFTPGGNAQPYLVFGWGDVVADGTWTRGPLALVRLAPAAGHRARPLTLVVRGRAFIERGHPRLRVEVAVNGQVLDQRTFRSPAGFTARVHIPPELAQLRPAVDVEFRIRNPEAPLYLGTGSTRGFLGLDVLSLELRAE